MHLAFQRALIQPDLLQSTDDISSVIDLPPAMSDFDHLRYCKTPNVEVIKRPQNTLSKGQLFQIFNYRYTHNIYNYIQICNMFKCILDHYFEN